MQLGPDLARDDARLGYFLEQLPPWIHTSLEFRHPSWTDDHVFAMLEHHTVAYCVVSGAHLPYVLRATAPFVYLRLHGPDPHHLFAGSYSIEDLKWWAGRLHEWDAASKDVFVHVTSDGRGHTVCNASPSANLFVTPRGVSNFDRAGESGFGSVSFGRDHELGVVAVAADPSELLLGDR